MKIRVVFVVVVSLILLALALGGGFVLVWRLFFLSVLLPLLGYLWILLGIHGIESQVMNLPEQCQVGDWFE